MKKERITDDLVTEVAAAMTGDSTEPRPLRVRPLEPVAHLKAIPLTHYPVGAEPFLDPHDGTLVAASFDPGRETGYALLWDAPLWANRRRRGRAPLIQVGQLGPRDLRYAAGLLLDRAEQQSEPPVLIVERPPHAVQREFDPWPQRVFGFLALMWLPRRAIDQPPTVLRPARQWINHREAAATMGPHATDALLHLVYRATCRPDARPLWDPEAGELREARNLREWWR